jgi:DNA repair protein SbcC/Rad50
MKPIKLKISAFGPYKNVVDIDFNKLGNNGIFLITGDTGAGKTTIFDAICFALFGEVSGSNRTIDSLRSDFATPDVKTFVELEFTHKNKNYKIERYPKYLKQKKNGVGTTPSVAEASLVFDDSVITGFKEVTDKVIEILGVNVKQFKQIAMLAQGEFLQLLFADAAERSNIFRKIFETSVFYSISEKLRLKTNQIKGILDDKQLELEIYMKNIQWDNVPDSNLVVPEIIEILSKLIVEDNLKEIEYQNKKNEYQNILDNVNKELTSSEYINKSIDELVINKIILEKMLQDNEVIEENIITIQNNRVALEKVNPIKNSIEKIKLEIRNEEENLNNINKILIDDAKKLEDLQDIYDGLDEKGKELKKYNSTVNNLSEKLPFYDAIEKLVTVINETKIDLEEIINKCNKITETNIELENVIENKTNLFSDRNNIESSVTLLKKEQEDVSRQIDKYNQLIEDITEVNSLEDNQVEMKKQYLIEQQEYNTIQTNYNDFEMKFLSNQAGIFASKLEYGLPCLVCGSTEHPNPAKTNGELITKEELDILKLSKEELHIKLLEHTENLNNLDMIITFKKRKIIKDTNLDYELDIVKNEVCKLINIANEKLELIIVDILNKQKLIQTLEGLKSELEEDKKALGINKDSIRECDELITIKRSKLDSANGEISSLIKNLPKEYHTKNDLEINIKIIIEKSNSLEQDISDIKSKYSELNTNLEKNKVLCAKTKDIILNDKVKCEQLELQYKSEYEGIGFTCEEDYLNILISREDLNSLEKKVNNYKTEFKIVEQTVKRLLVDTKDKFKIDTADLVDRKTDILNKLLELEKVSKKLNLRLQINNDNHTRIKELYLKIKDIIDNYLLYKDLSDTANGTISGKQKIIFEHFVQASYFDIVIQSSNRRLTLMTGDRYLLARKENSEKISDKLGLELEIMDNYTGKRRNIKSLSGGESFKAALSLALGLSDTIQNYAGGVVIDNMFIDEGFGSLDAESLEQALNTLNNLTEGNRLIGIISHVAELKERIDKKIIIYKTNNGSDVKIEI